MSPRFVTVREFSPSRKNEGEKLVEKTWGSLPPKEVSPRGVPFKETLKWCSSSVSTSEAPWRTTWIWACWEDEEARPSTEKVLSLSDGSAAYIKKGGRDPVIGYKPQLVRSEKGFVTSLIVPQGNAADSIKLEPAIRDSIERTGVIAQLVSTDDGYASAKGRDELLEMGVKTISISGAKGKKLTAPQDWESEVYRDARRNRSAVESLMFTIKEGFEFGELGRRGIQGVRSELLEKVLAYNCCRLILMKQRVLEKLKQAA